MEGCGGCSWVHFNLNVLVAHSRLNNNKKKKVQNIVQVFAYKSVSSSKVFNLLPFSVLHTWPCVAVYGSRSHCTTCEDYLRITCFPICSDMWTVKKISLFLAVVLVWLHSLDYDFQYCSCCCCLYMTKVWINLIHFCCGAYTFVYHILNLLSVYIFSRHSIDILCVNICRYMYTKICLVYIPTHKSKTSFLGENTLTLCMLLQKNTI